MVAPAANSTRVRLEVSMLLLLLLLLWPAPQAGIQLRREQTTCHPP
jgi:hypothetical protein